MTGTAPVVTEAAVPMEMGVTDTIQDGLVNLRHMLAVDLTPTTVDNLSGRRPRPRKRPDGEEPPYASSAGDSGPSTPHPDNAEAGSAEVRALVARAQKGDSEAFGRIYDHYSETVYRYIYFRVSNRQLAEDLSSEVFLRALRRIASFTWQGRDFGAWLVTIARNLVADHFKSGRYRLEMSTAEVLDVEREERAPEGNPEATVCDRLTNATLMEAVSELNPDQQECIMLRFLQGFSVAETARAMKKNEGAIKALQYRAVRALARLLPEGFTR